MELCLNFFPFKKKKIFFLSVISLLVWQVQKPGAGLNSAKQNIEVYLIVRCVPFPSCCTHVVTAPLGVIYYLVVRVRLIWGNVITV